MSPLVVVAYVGCALIWGTTFFAIRVCIGEGGYPTYLSAALRFVIAAAILGAAVVAGIGRPLPRGRPAYAWLTLCGLLNAAGYALIYGAEERIPGGLAATVFGTYPLAVALVAGATGIERPSRAAVAGALVSLAGLALTMLERLDVSAAQAGGVAMVLASVFCSAFYNVIFKRHAKQQHPVATTTVFLAVTAVALLLFAAVAERRAPPWPPPPAPTLALLYLAVIGSVVAFAAYLFLVQRVSLMTLSSLVLMQPIIALIVDAIWEAQKIAPRTYTGVAVTLAGVLVNLGGTARARARAARSRVAG